MSVDLRVTEHARSPKQVIVDKIEKPLAMLA
jgi:hypothetical protein